VIGKITSLQLSIFISNMNIKFTELENLKYTVDDKKKFDYLYNALPKELVIESNFISYEEETWEEITKYIIKTSQHLKQLNEKRERERQADIVSNNVNVNTPNKIKNNIKINYNSFNDYNKNRNSSYNKRNNNNYNNNSNRNNNKNYKNIKNIQCWNCGKFGHYSEDCRNNNNRSSNSNNNNYRYKNKFKKHNGRHQISNSECKCNNKSNNINKNNYEKYIKKRTYYFNNYNEISGNESSNISTSILPFQDINYYKKHNIKYKNYRNRIKNNRYRFRVNNKKYKYIINFSKFSNKNNNKINNKINKDELLAWTLDSGASYHMTGNLKILSNIKKYNRRIYFPNGCSVWSLYKGDYIGFINNYNIILKNVLYVPVFKRNLISIDSLCDQHYKTVFHQNNNKNKISIYNKKIKKYSVPMPALLKHTSFGQVVIK